MAMDVGAFFSNVVVTFLLVITFFFLVIAFLYMIYGREEAAPAGAPKTPKTKTSS
jgi:hypothetical protein